MEILFGIMCVAFLFAMPIVAILILMIIMRKLISAKYNYLQREQQLKEEILEELKKQNKNL